MKKNSLLIALVMLLAGCRAAPALPPVTATYAAMETAGLPTLTAAPEPTATPIPMPAALRVNGEDVPQAEFDASLTQLKADQPDLDDAAARDKVILQLTDQTLLAQAAFASGFTLEEAALKQRLDDLAVKAGGQDKLDEWMGRMGYSTEGFRSALRRAAAAAWQRDRVMESVPAEMEQVRARQILVNTQDAANTALARARSAGTNFSTLAAGYDLTTGGDLYWFPRGYLTQQAVEDAAFSMEIGQVSEVIHSDIGYHIIQVTGHELRPLSADARQALQARALLNWLEEQRGTAQVEVLVP